MSRAISLETYVLRDGLYAYLLDTAVVSWDHFYPILTLVALEALIEATDENAAGELTKCILQQYLKEMMYGSDKV